MRKGVARGLWRVCDVGARLELRRVARERERVKASSIPQLASRVLGGEILADCGLQGSAGSWRFFRGSRF